MNSIIPIYPPNPQRFLVPSALEPIKRVNRRTRLLGPPIQSHHGRVSKEEPQRLRRHAVSSFTHTSYLIQPNTSSLIRHLLTSGTKTGEDLMTKSTDFPTPDGDLRFCTFQSHMVCPTAERTQSQRQQRSNPSWIRRSPEGNLAGESECVLQYFSPEDTTKGDSVRCDARCSAHCPFQCEADAISGRSHLSILGVIMK